MAKATTKWTFSKKFNGKNCTQIGLQIKKLSFLPLFNPFYLGNYKSKVKTVLKCRQDIF
jgi:hypothetical protein